MVLSDCVKRMRERMDGWDEASVREKKKGGERGKGGGTRQEGRGGEGTFLIIVLSLWSSLRLKESLY